MYYNPQRPEQERRGISRPQPVNDPDGITQPVPRSNPDGETQPNLPQPAYPPYPPPVEPPSQPPASVPPYYPPPPPGYPPPPEPLERYQPIRRTPMAARRRRSRLPWKGGCAFLGGLIIIFILLGLAFVGIAIGLAPGKTNILVIGIDRVENGSGNVARTDTIVLVQVDPQTPRIATLAIPRDLWVKIPGVGENRINTAHFFAEANQAGSGPAAVIQTIQSNFGVSAKYYVRLHLEGIPALVDAMGGVTIDLPQATALYSAGQHYLNGTQALAFVRDRKNADDFFRMADGQLFIKAAGQQMLNPLTWVRLPLILAALPGALDTNIPAGELPSLALTVLRVGPGNIDSRTLPREATTPTVTSGGADVLMPKWNVINPLVKQIFGN